jgi:hypothetical protein
MSYIYIASPYTHENGGVMECRYSLVSEYAAFLKRAGLACYSPIAYGHPMACKHKLPRDFGFWRKQSLALLAPAGSMHVLMLDGWQNSQGVQQEIDFCRSMDKRILYMGKDKEAWEAMASPFKVVKNVDI